MWRLQIEADARLVARGPDEPRRIGCLFRNRGHLLPDKLRDVRGFTETVTSVVLVAALSGCGAGNAPTATVTGTSPSAKTGTSGPPRSETVISVPSPDNVGQPAPRGILSKESYWNEKFAARPVSDCVGQGDRVQVGPPGPQVPWIPAGREIGC